MSKGVYAVIGSDSKIVVLVNNKVLAPEQAREELLRTVDIRYLLKKAEREKDLVHFGDKENT